MSSKPRLSLIRAEPDGYAWHLLDTDRDPIGPACGATLKNTCVISASGTPSEVVASFAKARLHLARNPGSMQLCPYCF